MKNRTKKIIAGVGMGLTLAGGGMMMTGCTETPVTDAQVDRVFEALDNANQFIEDTIAKFTEQNTALVEQNAKLDILNAELSEKNDKLQLIISEMEKQNKDQLYEDIVKLYNHSVRRMQLNLDNIWDNMRVTLNSSVYALASVSAEAAEPAAS